MVAREDSREPLIDPEIRAFIFSLVSALGGSSAGDDGRYVLGDDALAVLKDIKRWLRLYDDKTNRLDVARLLAEANLVRGDLLEILARWSEDVSESSFRYKVSLLSVDLLTQLTWPIEKDEASTTIHHFLHIPFLHAAQASYKRAVLHHDTSEVLRTIIRVALPAMAQPCKDRSLYHDNIIKVILYFMRNIAMISQPEGAFVDENESDISRSSTINAFHKQDVFTFILTICSGMAEEFGTHDVEVLDLLFHLLKGVDAERLFMERDEGLSSNTKELQGLIKKEKTMLAGYARYAPSRHNRFGAMSWIKRDDERYSTVLGQRALANEALAMVEMDKSKTWKRPRVGKRREPEEPLTEFDSTVPLTVHARRNLRAFIEQFLDSSFNPLFTAVRRTVEREADRLLDHHSRQYLYLISWFLRAECARRKQRMAKKSHKAGDNDMELESFTLVASVLNQETFVLINRHMQTAQDNKNWQDLNAGMKCFTQILLTVQEMFESPLDEDQEISENILNRIFYEQATHDRVIALLRSYKNQSFGYLDACTKLSHVFLRLLERYAKQNVDLQVRSRRRARKQNKNESGAAHRDRDAEDVAEAKRTTTERKFDFIKFAARFVNQSSIDTFVALVRHYKDLTVEQLKRAHRFFYRVAFKMDLSIYLFRLDIVALFNKLIKGPEGLDNESGIYKEWQEFVQQLFRRLVKKLQERPVLFIELLFSKVPSTIFYLEHGYEPEVPKKIFRAPAELEFKPGLNREQQIGVAVSVLINQSKSDALTWVKGVLSSTAQERKAWENVHAASCSVEQPENQAFSQEDTQSQPVNEQPPQPRAPSILIKADSPDRGKAMQRDKHLRLLLTVLGFQVLGGFTDDENSADPVSESWIVPSSISSTQMTNDLELINKLEFDPPVYDEGKSADDFLRRKTTVRLRESRTAQSFDSEGVSDVDGLFPAGGPTVRNSSRSPRRKESRRKRNRHQPDDLIDDGLLEEKRNARRKLEAQKRGKIKSDLFVHDSDDESDEERDKAFFREEEQRRKTVGGVLLRQMVEAEAVHKDDNGNGERKRGQKSAGGKRKRHAWETEGEEESAEEQGRKLQKRKKRPQKHELFDHENLQDTTSPSSDQQDSDTDVQGREEDTDTDTSLSLQRQSSGHSIHPNKPIRPNARFTTQDPTVTDASQSDSDKENAGAGAGAEIKAVVRKRRNVRAGFIIDSDSE